jgi:hypothetical protein
LDLHIAYYKHFDLANACKEKFELIKEFDEVEHEEFLEIL